MPRLLRFPLCALVALVAMPAWAQTAAQPSSSRPENVRIEYAQVLRAEPVYQTLHATSMVERCDSPATAEEEDPPRRGLSRVVGAVRGALTPDPKVEEVAPSAGGECRMVPVDREFRRPIAYEVDYVHKGVKYRSRLPYDPGNRIRVRVSVTPVVHPVGP